MVFICSTGLQPCPWCVCGGTVPHQLPVGIGHENVAYRAIGRTRCHEEGANYHRLSVLKRAPGPTRETFDTDRLDLEGLTPADWWRRSNQGCGGRVRIVRQMFGTSAQVSEFAQVAFDRDGYHVLDHDAPGVKDKRSATHPPHERCVM